MHLFIQWLPSIIIRQRLSSSALLEQTGWVIGKTREKRPSSLDRSSPNKMPLSDLLLLPSYSPPESNNLQRVWAYIIKGAISPISSKIPRFGEKSYIVHSLASPRLLSQEIIETTAAAWLCPWHAGCKGVNEEKWHVSRNQELLWHSHPPLILILPLWG